MNYIGSLGALKYMGGIKMPVCPRELKLSVKFFNYERFDEMAQKNPKFIRKQEIKNVPYYELTDDGKGLFSKPLTLLRLWLI
ncbi:MAG: hypothetical protein GTN36_00900 [Candidatus Aenigmarchaeota archaeon]|nr:hypothetical protein [Candidatus Aenigmarchaeota archaeon]